MPGSLYAAPGDNVTADATLSWAVGTANAAYPITNAATLEPDVVAKANETTATLRATFGSPVPRLVGIAIINCSFPGKTATLTNNAGMVAQAITVPNPEDGLCVNAWWDLRDVAQTNPTQWNIAVVSNAVPIAIGTLLLIEEWHEPRIKWGYDIADRFPVIELRTGHQKRMQYRIPVRYRMFTGVTEWAEDREAIRTLKRSAQGSIIPWCFVPDEDDPDVALVQFSGDTSKETYTFHDGRFDDDTVEGVVEQPIEVEEVNAGVTLT